MVGLDVLSGAESVLRDLEMESPTGSATLATAVSVRLPLEATSNGWGDDMVSAPAPICVIEAQPVPTSVLPSLSALIVTTDFPGSGKT